MDNGFREINNALKVLIELNTRYEGLSKQVDKLEADSDYRFDKLEQEFDRIQRNSWWVQGAGWTILTGITIYSIFYT